MLALPFENRVCMRIQFKLVIPFLIVASFMSIACHSNEKKDAASSSTMLPFGDSVATCIADGMPSRGDAVTQAEIVSSPIGVDNSTMVWLPSGSFQMGSNEFPDAQPIHQVQLDGFWIDEHEVTNAQFAQFVEATGYQTIAERALNPSDFPNVPLDMLVPGSAVFSPPNYKVELNDHIQWWQYVAGANWRHPEGPSSSIKGKEHYPVVQVSYVDAAAYAAWAGKRLPTEAEWEYAARSMKKNPKYYWGNELKPEGSWVANVFQGDFPTKDSEEDGFAGPAPVKSFPANAFGLYDMDGNVWEWCADFYRSGYYKSSPVKNPKGPSDSFDPQEPGMVKRVQRGGSFLCSDQYCERYIAGSRGKGEVSSASNNIGFRCVSDTEGPQK